VLERTLGPTGLRVTQLGVGLAALGRPAYINIGREQDLGQDRSVAELRRRTYEVLDASLAAGVRYIDVARSYGLAEEFLASWLDDRRVPEDAVTIGSKWGYTYTAGWRLDAPTNEVKDHSLKALQRQYQESRAILGRRLALYQVHSATPESGILQDREVLAELARLRSEGLAIGLTVSGPRQAEVVRQALAVVVDGVNPFATVQATWNLLEPSAGPALGEAHQAGLGVLLKEVLANGRLTERSVDLPERLHEIARDRPTTIDQLAIAAAAANPWGDVVLSGAVTPAQLQANLAAVPLDEPRFTDAELRSWAEPPDRYWSRRQSVGWR
jgi:aryl-alcohol dehydrogenase-like predicted oxidoreductase